MNEYKPKRRDTPYTKLAAAIVEKAVLDYRDALRVGDSEIQKNLEYFFKSEWFDTLSDLDGNILIRMVKRMEVQV